MTDGAYSAYLLRRVGQFVLVMFIGINITFFITHEPSRGGPDRRSPKALALSDRRRWLVSKRSQSM